jgi:hypothetical protein
MKLAAILILLLLAFGCTGNGESEKLLADSAKKANSLDTYVLEYRRTIVSYIDPEDNIHLVPPTTITKYRKGGKEHWESRDWLNNTLKLYGLGSEYYSCTQDGGWNCSEMEESRMKEFLGFDVSDPGLSIGRAVASGALLLGNVEQETVFGRESACLALEIRPESFSEEDWGEHVLGSMADSRTHRDFRELKAWQCMDKETGVKTKLVLNYKSEVNGELHTVEVNIELTGFDFSPKIDDSVFELPSIQAPEA